MAVHVQEGLFDLQIIAQKLKKLHNSGASVTFEGYVRDFDLNQDKLDILELEHYPGMTEKALLKAKGVKEISLKQIITQK
jgi:molybdopterin synthase catalytic subunit